MRVRLSATAGVSAAALYNVTITAGKKYDLRASVQFIMRVVMSMVVFVSMMAGAV